MRQNAVHFVQPQYFNSLWPSDAIWWNIYGSTLAQIMACCLMAPSHYLNQFWLYIGKDFWHSHEGNFTGNAQDFYPSCDFENKKFGITDTLTRGQWVNICWFGCLLLHSLHVRSAGIVAFVLFFEKWRTWKYIWIKFINLPCLQNDKMMNAPDRNQLQLFLGCHNID